MSSLPGSSSFEDAIEDEDDDWDEPIFFDKNEQSFCSRNSFELFDTGFIKIINLINNSSNKSI